MPTANTPNMDWTGQQFISSGFTAPKTGLIMYNTTLYAPNCRTEALINPAPMYFDGRIYEANSPFLEFNPVALPAPIGLLDDGSLAASHVIGVATALSTKIPASTAADYPAGSYVSCVEPGTGGLIYYIYIGVDNIGSPAAPYIYMPYLSPTQISSGYVWIDRTDLEEDGVGIGTEGNYAHGADGSFSSAWGEYYALVSLDENGQWFNYPNSNAGSPERITGLLLSPVTDPRHTAAQQSVGVMSTMGSPQIEWPRSFQQTLIVNKGDVFNMNTSTVPNQIPYDPATGIARTGWIASYVPFQNSNSIIGIDWADVTAGPTDASNTAWVAPDNYLWVYQMGNYAGGNVTIGNIGDANAYWDGVTSDGAVFVWSNLPSGPYLPLPSVGSWNNSPWNTLAASFLLSIGQYINIACRATPSATVLQNSKLYKLIVNGYSLDSSTTQNTFTNFEATTKITQNNPGFVCASGGSSGNNTGFTVVVNGRTIMHGASNGNSGNDHSFWWFGDGGDEIYFLKLIESEPYSAYIYTTSLIGGGVFIPGAVMDSSGIARTRNVVREVGNPGSQVQRGGYEIINAAGQPVPIFNIFGDQGYGNNMGTEVDTLGAVTQMQLE